MKMIILFFMTVNLYAKINGEFSSDFKKNGMECAIAASLKSKKVTEITFEKWDMLCEDNEGNSIESSLEDKMKYEKIGQNKLKVTQGSDSITLDAKVLEFKEDYVHYNFEVDTEDGRLEINEEYSLKNKLLNFKSLYILDGKEIIKNEGVLERSK